MSRSDSDEENISISWNRLINIWRNLCRTYKEYDHHRAFSFIISGAEVISKMSIIVSILTEEFESIWWV